MKGSQGNVSRRMEHKLVKYFVWRIQFRRIQSIGRVRPDGVWHERERDYPSETEANLKLADARKQSGAYLFQYRIMRQERTRIQSYYLEG